LSYRVKRDDETWNQYLIKIFREGGHINYMHFLNKYFNEERTEEYREGLKKEKDEATKKLSKSKKQKDSTTTEDKVTFAKKPERLKKKKEKGYLF